jgi:hypothetical protein
MSQSKKHRLSKQRAQTPHVRRTDSRLIWIVVAGCILLAVGALFFVLSASNPGQDNQQANYSPQVSGAPRLSIASDTLDHGYVKLGTTVNSVFSVRNVGDKLLQILGEPRVELVEGC